MLKFGEISQCTISEKTESGYFVEVADSKEKIFMPSFMAPINAVTGQEVAAYIYKDNKGRSYASSELPYAVVGEYAYLEAIEVQEFGAFFDFGIDKDLLVPGNQQKAKVKQNEKHIVRVCLDPETEQTFGTTKIGKFIEEEENHLLVGDKVKFQACFETDLGFRVIIDKKYIGMIYHNEIYENIIEGETYTGIVKNIRIDGLVDISLQKLGIKNLDDATIKIMNALRKNKGSLNLHDKSSPEDIKHQLGMSKKTFKNAIGMLYKKRKILISSEGIKLNIKS